jgi:hypothetical protein
VFFNNDPDDEDALRSRTVSPGLRQQQLAPIFPQVSPLGWFILGQ